jgi:hypothetical protein
MTLYVKSMSLTQKTNDGKSKPLSQSLRECRRYYTSARQSLQLDPRVLILSVSHTNGSYATRHMILSWNTRILTFLFEVMNVSCVTDNQRLRNFDE